MKYRALLTDLDRTLVVSKDALPSRAVRDAFAKVQGTIHIGIATGRPYERIKPICEFLQLSGPSIASGGAQIVNVKTGRCYTEFPIDTKTTIQVLTLLSSVRNMMRFWVQDDGKNIEYTHSYKPYKPFVIVAHGMSEETANKLLHTLSLIPNIFETKVVSHEVGLIDIHVTHRNVSKQHGVLEIARILNISVDEIIGVGDGYNDFPLLMACGLKVAMGNAVPELKEIADFIAPSVEDDGLVAVIDKYLID